MIMGNLESCGNLTILFSSPGISFTFECGYVGNSGALCFGWFKDPGMNCFLKIPFSKWSFFFNDEF